MIKKFGMDFINFDIINIFVNKISYLLKNRQFFFLNTLYKYKQRDKSI